MEKTKSLKVVYGTLTSGLSTALTERFHQAGGTGGAS